MIKYELFHERTFNDKFSLAFDWLRDHWRAWLKWATLFLLPVSLVQAVGQQGLMSFALLGSSMGTPATDISPSTWLQFGLAYLLAIVGSLLVAALAYTLIKRSMIDNYPLEGLTARTLWRQLWPNLGQVVIGSIFMGLVCVVLMLIAVVPAMTGSVAPLFLTIPLCLCLFANLLPFLPAYVLDRKPFTVALRDAWKLGTSCWGGFVGAVLVMGILSSVIQGFGSVPYYIFVFSTAFVMQQSGDVPVWLSFVGYLSTVLTIFVSYVVSILPVLILCIQYGHAVDKVFGKSSEEEIEGFLEE